ncbi:hypothetical protein [Hwangdonia lutea]|uniref:Uncharacterized protein n=1 Tax=Hwangdonia lutea TaxID=3075823 RepID=A0AA97EQF9_9FLAO|nr:hypothetical protein [Hwangdonia sp. SCSIO 19198]WOD45201.1 hypothetical protein RNZ46_07995 [Hwangdonia sp. SCSIO 19198]
MKAEELLKQFDKINTNGMQLSKRRGLLTSTWLLYQKNNFYYFFDIMDNIVFCDDYKYSKDEFLEEYKNSYFKIDCEIS